jgi:preprotein translocase subunit SecG
LIYLLYTIHVLVCLFLILVVLLQQGKGADLSVFGGGATQAAFGARGAVSLLHKLTVWGFVAFIVTTVTIGFMTSSRRSSSVLSNVPAGEETAVEETMVEETAVEETAPVAEEAIEETAEPVEDTSTDAGSESETPEGEATLDDGGQSE